MWRRFVSGGFTLFSGAAGDQNPHNRRIPSLEG
jgi:hypothetical protein